ncbi:MAG: 1-acyl-sn-glycerol-3-phosphate acyltransferase [Blastocatellia bacterium]|jgi:1-acyl-sn-glycerol-3-phosphate acyltransferase|nr:1-acyl-sn-glycerol-3-phosphate acyltransferase [Blastocatellia bacterium]
MSKVQSPGPNTELVDHERQDRTDVGQTPEPTPEEFAALTWFERFAFRLTRRMNQGRWKRFWTWCQSTMGAGWIYLSTYNIMNVYGLENVEAVARDRPILLVSNHRSFFDMYAVSTVLFRNTSWRKQLFFPVRGRFFYDSPLGLLVNLIMGWWSMYPPFFAAGSNPVPGKREFDQYSLRLLTDLCRQGAGNVIGFHPEGTRNKSSDPYSLLAAKPGVGKIIKDAEPQVIPVFTAGLTNSLPRQVARNWNREDVIRIHFGPAIDFSEFRDKRNGVRTYKEIAERVMSKIAELGENDRHLRAK